MSKPLRLICPTCKKVNPSSRTRCMYCENDLTGATLAPDTYIPQTPHSKRVPWMTVLIVLAAAGAAAYFFLIKPWLAGN